MRVTVRQYDHAADYDEAGRFLVRTYRTADEHINWLQPRWEYMFYHPLIRGVDTGSIGIWEADGEMVGIAHPEHDAGTVYFEIDPGFAAIKAEMIVYAEKHLSTARGGARRLRIFINDHDDEFRGLASGMGFTRTGYTEPMSFLPIPAPLSDTPSPPAPSPPGPTPPAPPPSDPPSPALLPSAPPPPGFKVKSLVEDNDLRKVDRVLWRGFGHGDEPPADGIDDRKFMQSAPNYRRDLNIVVEAPDGNFASYCGIWFEPVHSIAYVEPVATDPDYRRMGLARVAVLEGIHRCGAMGAGVACVGAALPLYLSLGFRPVYSSSLWQKEWK